MSLRRKTLFVLFIALAGFILLLYILLRTIMLDSFTALETQSMLRDLSRADATLRDNLDSMGRGLRDWSSWDETYQFVQDQNANYMRENLADDTFTTLDINLMLFIDLSNHVVYGQASDVDPAWQAGVIASFERQSDLLAHMVDQAPTAGYFVIDDEPVMLASRPILHSNDDGPPAGTLIWARHLNADVVERIFGALQLPLKLLLVQPDQNPAEVQTVLASETPQMVQVIDEHTISGYVRIDNVFAQPLLVLGLTENRSILGLAQESLNSFILVLSILGLLFGAVGLMVLEAWLLEPLARMSERVQRVGVDGDFSLRLPVKNEKVNTQDELMHLAVAFNTALDTINQSRNALSELNGELERRVVERTEALEQQTAQLEAIMDTMGEGLIYSVKGSIRYINGALSKLLGYEVAELVDKPLSLLSAELDAEDTPIYLDGLAYYETRWLRSNGTPINVAVTSTAIEPADERRWVTIVRDITQELAIKAQKDYFFARASHELRTPLTSIMTRLYLLDKKPEQLDDHLHILNQISNKMMSLINDLLDSARIEQNALTLNRTDVVLQTVASDVVTVQRADAELKGIRLLTNWDAEPLHVYADGLRLYQVINNLVSNAIHYTPQDGTICVKIVQHEHDAVIEVIDSGIGINPDHLKHVFEPFFRVNEDHGTGSGLGLYIVKEIVELHGGTISISSEYGSGSTFAVRLALLESPAILPVSDEPLNPLSVD